MMRCQTQCNSSRSKSSGQTTTEAIILLPFFFLMVFGLLQLGQLGTALVIVNYAASSIARQAVLSNGTGEFTGKLGSLLTVGMKNPVVSVAPEGSGMLRNVRVHACAEVSAFPFVGQLLGRPLTSGLGSGSSGGCSDIRGAFAFNNSVPARFVVHGTAKARMNYR